MNGQPDGTVKLTCALLEGNVNAIGRKISANEYAYKTTNGLRDYAFHATFPRDDDNSYYPNDYVCSYFLGTVLAINEEQVKELEETGTMTFLKGVSVDRTGEYQYVYPGLPELLGLKDSNPLNLYIESSFESPMKYTITNRSASPVEGYYALLSYWPTTSYYPANEISPFESEYFYGHVLPLEVNLAPGESVEGKLYSVVSGWPTMIHKWIKFDSQAEYASFLRTDVLKYEFPSDQDILTIDRGQNGIQWMQDTFGIKILSGKDK